MKLQSLCDTATVPRTPPVGLAGVLHCWESLCRLCVRIPSAGPGQGVPRFWVPVTQRALLPLVISQRAQFLFKPMEDNVAGRDKHRFLPLHYKNVLKSLKL